MYRKDSEGWLKHADFIVLDMICLQLAFILAYAFRGYGFNVYGDILYRNMAIFLGFANLVVIFTSGTMKSVLKRGHYKEFVTTLKNAVAVGALAIAYLFIIQEGQSFSRMILITTIVIYLVLTYAIREIWKNSLHRKMENGGDKKLLIITSKAVAKNVVHSMQENNYARYSLAGVVVIDEDCTGEKICGVPVVAGESDVPMYVCQEWIDEVLIVVSENLPYPDELIDKLTETGVTVHLNLAKITNQTGKRQFVEKVGSYTVLTTSLNYASFGQLFLKRLMDICGGLVGCIFTGIITIFVGPAIYLASPGPIFFSQERVGKNGKKFKMYKFRSMYMDAEARKAELMKENKLGDGKMFKMDFDPRVIGNKVLPDGSHKTGVGDFIRRTSLDEFPQFFNVLKGDMSIVGTRPPLISETNLYEPHHKVRLAIKPGITGMWQVSGRSDITDFEEVVRLDKEYIENWDIGLDGKFSEDLFTIYKTILKSENVTYVGFDGYFYYYRDEGSIVVSGYKEKHLEALDAIDDIARAVKGKTHFDNALSTQYINVVYDIAARNPQLSEFQNKRIQSVLKSHRMNVLKDGNAPKRLWAFAAISLFGNRIALKVVVARNRKWKA